MIGTKRLRLRALTTRDLPLFAALYCNARTMRHIGRPLPRRDAMPSLRATVAATRSGRLRFYTIVERQSRRGVGICSARPAAWDELGAELGIMLLPDACGRGHAREALRALIDDAFFRLPIEAVWVQYRRANTGMARLADSLGFGSALAPRAGANVRRCVRIPPRP